MFKKQILLLFYLILFQSGHIILGQNYFVSNSYNNYMFSNPSYVHFFDYSIGQLNYRNQWPVSNLYTSYGVAYFHNAENLNSNFGAIINFDSQYKGTYSKLSGGINYSYKLQTSRKSHLLFGLQAFYNYASTNYSQLQFENQSLARTDIESAQYPTINVGLAYLIFDNHFIGASINNLLADKEFPENELQYKAGYIGRIKAKSYYSNLYFEPLLHFSTNLDYIQLQYGTNINYNGLKGGLALNQSNLNVNTLIILLGISFENYEFVYTYDLNLSGAVLINPKMAAHEVTFLKKFQYKGRRKRRGAIKCPDI